MVISVEDIGFGDTNAPVLIHSLCQLAEKQDRGSGDRMLFTIHAVRFLCGCLKDRSSDEMLNWVKRAVEKQGEWPVIPDYALDMHTEKGKAMGRGKKHFYQEGAKISPELTDRELTYLNRIMELIDKGEIT